MRKKEHFKDPLNQRVCSNFRGSDYSASPGKSVEPRIQEEQCRSFAQVMDQIFILTFEVPKGAMEV